ncbi:MULTISPECIES: hypothetical protein [unclassified Helicobacter]|uniref:hypothetical protein n=1 Tax=unclassified Helicobacter TaxID=2593540 RepID=UPI000CF10110|nr:MULTISPECIES: hypothetical protein [unclassified Helicobacter]
MHNPSLKSMKIFLQSRGYDTDNKEKQEILELYKKICSQEICLYQNDIFDNNFFEAMGVRENAEFITLSQTIGREVEEIQTDVKKLYILLDKYIEKFPYEELKFLIFSRVKKIPFLTIERILKIKYCEYQEVWLEKIEKNLKVLPQEERMTLMQYYQQIRNNIPLLFKVYQKSFDEQEVQRMKEVAENKLLLLKNYEPQMLEESYKVFYDDSEEKMKLVREVLELTHSYTKHSLKHMPVKNLLELKEEIKRQKHKEEQSKKLILKHIKILEESILMASDSEFDMACINAVNELNSEELQKVLDYLGSQNKFFINKFESVAKQISGRMKAKIF